MGDVISTLLFQPPDEPTPIARSKLLWLETRLGSRIPAIYLNPYPGRFTLLYSHGNAEDLGMLYEYLKELARLLKVNILAYDYTGYGLATIANEVEAWAFNPSEEHCYADIEAAYHHLTDVERVEPASIILYGRSLGSGPSCYLAEKMGIGIESGEKICGGLILHSPFLSVCRVVVDLGFTFNGDMFPNIERVKNLDCPVLVVHGTEDPVVPFHHGKKLFEELPRNCRTPPFWAKNLGHNDIELHQPRQFIKELRKFLNTAAKNPTLKKTIAVENSLTMPREESSTVSTSAKPKSMPLSSSIARQPEPITYEGRSPSPERGESGGIPKTNRNGTSTARDSNHGATDERRVLPSPPPVTKLPKVEKGSGRQGTVLGKAQNVVPRSRSLTKSPTRVRPASGERKKSKVNLQQQQIQTKGLSSSRSGSCTRQRSEDERKRSHASPSRSSQRTLSPSRSGSFTRQRSEDERKRSKVNLQQQMIHARTLFASRSSSVTRQRSGRD